MKTKTGEPSHNDKAAFHFNLTSPSIFTSGTRLQNFDFAGLGASGLDRGRIATLAVLRREQTTGRSPGSINGLSKVGDDLIELGQQHRRRGK